MPAETSPLLSPRGHGLTPPHSPHSFQPSPGHSPGHQVLFLKLAKTGPVVLSGDLYHYPEERKPNLVPATEYNAEQTLASRAMVEAFLKKTGAQLWIQHDFNAMRALRKTPEFYE